MGFLYELNDIVKTFCLPIIIGIFTFATPLILQTISRVDDKYNSTLLAKLFVKDMTCQAFIWTGVLSFLSILIWILHLPRLVECGSFNIWIENSASLLILLFTILLIITSCGTLYLTFIYYIPDKLAKRLQKQHNKYPNNRIYFDAVCKVLNYSISKADEPLARQTYSTIQSTIIKCREKTTDKGIEYPDEIYDNIFEANELLLKRERKTISYMNDGAFLSIFIDEYQQTRISDKTYHYLWICLRQAIHYNNEEAIKAYWERAHNYATTLSYKTFPQYNSKDKINDEKTTKEHQEALNKFIEFHYALGGLLLYNNMYSTLNYIMYWTDSQPPKYNIVPSTMSEVIRMYMQIAQKDKNCTHMYFETKYPFLGVKGVDAGDTIRHWIKKYIALLFIRQYTLESYYINDDLFQMPVIPDSMSEKRFWDSQLDFLKNIINQFFDNKNILQNLGFGELTDIQWFEKNKKEKPKELIDSYKAAIENNIEQTYKEQPISKEKIKEFNSATIKIIKPVFELYKKVFNGDNTSQDYKSIFSFGSNQLIEKDAYVDNQEKSYGNTDTIVAECAAIEFRQTSLNIFLFMTSKRYILKAQDLLRGVKQICNNREDLIVFSIGVNLNYLKYIDQLLVYNDGQWSYDNVTIIDINDQGNEFVSNSLWVIKKEDIPCITFNDILRKETTNKFSLEEIDEDYHIYTSIIDLDNNSTVKEELKKAKAQNLDKKALVCVNFNSEIRCNIHSRAIQLKTYSQLKDKEQTNTITDLDTQWFDT